MRWVGWTFVALWLAGMLNLIDVHVCIAGAGDCACKLKEQ